MAGGRWKVGSGGAAATVQMDALDFSIFASGRFTYAEGCAKATVSGDMDLAELAMRNTLVLF